MVSAIVEIQNSNAKNTSYGLPAAAFEPFEFKIQKIQASSSQLKVSLLHRLHAILHIFLVAFDIFLFKERHIELTKTNRKI